MRLIRFILLFIAVNSALASQSQKAGSFDTSSFKKDIKRYFIKLGLPGLSVCVVHKGNIVYRHVEGYADLSKKTPITANSLFPIASVTKGFTAVLMMKYAEEGKISLDDPLLKYPFFRLGYSPASISPDVRLKHFLSQTSQSGPGLDFVYNGGRFNYIYGVFEKLSGQQTVPKAYFQELQRNILYPLHLSSTLPGLPW